MVSCNGGLFTVVSLDTIALAELAGFCLQAVRYRADANTKSKRIFFKMVGFRGLRYVFDLEPDGQAL